MSLEDEVKYNLWYLWFKRTREEQLNKEFLVIFGNEEDYFDALTDLVHSLVYDTKESVTLRDKKPCVNEYSYKTPWCDIYKINTEYRFKSFEEINQNREKNIILFVNETYEDFFNDLKSLNIPMLYTDLDKDGINDYFDIINDLENDHPPISNLTKIRDKYYFYIDEFPEIMYFLKNLYFSKIENFLFYNIFHNTPISSNIEYLIKDI